MNSFDWKHIFRQAEHYRKASEVISIAQNSAAKALEKEGKSPGHALEGNLPAIVLGAFSIELYLKALLCAQGCREKDMFGHDAVELFKRLDATVQSELENRFLASYSFPYKAQIEKFYSEIVKADCPSSLVECLAQYEDVFTKARYAYETNRIAGCTFTHYEPVLQALRGQCFMCLHAREASVPA